MPHEAVAQGLDDDFSAERVNAFAGKLLGKLFGEKTGPDCNCTLVPLGPVMVDRISSGNCPEHGKG